MKKIAYALVCVNEERQVVSVDVYSTREDAQTAMFKAYDNELEDAHLDGFDVSNIYVASSPLDAYVKYGSSSYDWTIRIVFINPEDYK